MKKVFLFVSIMILGSSTKIEASSDSMLNSILSTQLIWGGYPSNLYSQIETFNPTDFYNNVIQPAANQLIIPSGNSAEYNYCQEYNNCTYSEAIAGTCPASYIDCTDSINFSYCPPCQTPDMKAKFINLQKTLYDSYVILKTILTTYINFIVGKNSTQKTDFNEKYIRLYDSIFHPNAFKYPPFWDLQGPSYSLKLFIGLLLRNIPQQAQDLFENLKQSPDLQNIFNVANCSKNLFNSSQQECAIQKLSYNKDGSVDFAASMQACQQQSNKCGTWNNNMLNSTYTSMSDMLQEAEGLSFLYHYLKEYMDRKDYNAVNNLTEIYQQSQYNSLQGTLNGAGIVLACNYALKQKNYIALKIIMRNTINYLSQIMTISQETYRWLGQKQLNNNPIALMPIDTF